MAQHTGNTQIDRSQSVDHLRYSRNNNQLTGLSTTASQKQFRQLAQTLDKPVRQELSSFAKAIEFGGHRAGLLADKGYRLRKEINSAQVIWWIEKDIPPYDVYRCASYRVELDRIEDGSVSWFFQSGSRKIPLDLNDPGALHEQLSRATHDPFLIILRQMGTVVDP